MTVNELYKVMNEQIPAHLSCEWDNDGLMCCPDGNTEVRRVLIALDVTDKVIDRAIEGNFNVIVSHHPFIFKGLRSINGENFVGAKSIKLIKNNISVMSFHTRLDALEGGVNDTLAEALGLLNVESFGEGQIGRVGELSVKTDLHSFASTVKEILDAPFVLVADASRPVFRVAILGGEGGDDIGAARAAGADTYLSGRLGYHSMTDAPECGMNLIEAGHFYTEHPVCERLCEMVKDICEGAYVEICVSNEIKAI